MKILSIQIDGFGVWSGLKLDGLGDRLTCFYGPNEAGKTTLMQFVRTVLYGFSAERRRYLPPLRGGEPGGLLQISGPMGRYVLRRRLASGPRARECGDLQLLAGDGTQLSGHLLAGLLGNVDETTFSQVFAIGLREIQELGTLSDSAAAELLYQLSTGLPGVSLSEVMRDLETSRERLLGPDRRPGQIVALLAERDRLRGEIEELRGLVHRHASLAGNLEDFEQQIGRRETERHDLQQALRTVELAVAVRETWRRRAQLNSELDDLPSLAPVPSDTVERLDRLNERLAARRRQAAEAARARRELKAEVSALGFNTRLARHAPRIEALMEQETWLATLENQVEQLSGDISNHEAELAQHLHELGTAKHATGADRADRGKLTARLRPAARALVGPRGRARLAESESAECRAKAEELSQQIRAALADGEHDELAPALEQAGNLVTLLRRRVQADERLAQLGRHEVELAEQGRQLLERQLLPVWVLLALGGVFVVGAMLILTTLFISMHAVGVTGWAMAIVGALGAIGGACGKFLLERSAAAQLDACQKQSGILASQIAQTKEERETLDRQLPHGGGPLLTRLQSAEKELARLEELLGVEARRQAALEAAAAAEARGRSAAEECRAAERRWRQALEAVGLPSRLSPRQVRHYADRRRTMARIEARLERDYQQLGERQRELDALTRRTEQLLADVGLEPVVGKPTEQLRRLKQLLADHQAIAAKREALGERARRLRRRQTKLALAIRQGEQRRGELLSSAGAAHESQLRGRAAEQARRLALAAQRDELTREIAAALAGRAAEDELAPLLDNSSDRDWEQRLDEVDGRLQTADRELAVLLDQRGRARQELASLAEDRRPGQRALDLSLVERQLQDAVDRWRALALSASVLDSVRRQYEAERQPETLVDASRYLSQLTAGRYTRIWAPLGERALRVDDAEGTSLPVDVLSRGTREQLFLGLRLALAGVYARRGIELPLVLDDVLVNFDDSRAKAAAMVLREFAEAGHQVLVFTCHEHLWRLFKQLQVPSHELPANNEQEPVTIAYARPTPGIDEGVPGEHRPAAAFWEPDDLDRSNGQPIIEIEADDVDGWEPPSAADNTTHEAEPAPPKRRAKKPRKPKASPPVGRIENQESRIEKEPAELTPPDEPEAREWASQADDVRPHRVTVVRPGQLQHPFADALWHQIVDDDDDEPQFERRISPPLDMATRDAARSPKSSPDRPRDASGRPESTSSPVESSPEADFFDEDYFEAASEESLFHDSDDWSGIDGPDDENEAA